MANRFAAEDAFYQSFRTSIKDRTFSVEDLDHFTLYTGIHNFARKRFLVDELEGTLNLTGNIYEFGTWRGATLTLLASWYRLRRPQGHKIIFAFDSFEGLADGTATDGNAHNNHTGEYKGNYEELRDLTTMRGMDDYVRFIIGDILETAPKHFADIPLQSVSFALIDVDLFEPSRVIIDQVLPRLVPGGKIILDEATTPEWEGEQRALSYLQQSAEALGMTYSLTENAITRQPTTVFQRAASHLL